MALNAKKAVKSEIVNKVDAEWDWWDTTELQH